MKVNYSNIKFSGYSNIITNSLIGSENESIDFIAMRLDDRGEKDLSNFRHILKMMDMPEFYLKKDIMTYTNCIHHQIGEVGILSDSMLNCGEGLLVAQKKLPEDEYKKLERFTLKAYTFVANLTKRIMNDDTISKLQNTKIRAVYEEAIRGIGNIFYNPSDTYQFITECSVCQKDIQKTAKTINNKIAKSISIIF